jgi:hypothetical protein
VHVKASLKLRNPLVDKVWRAQHRGSFDIASVEQLARD